MAIRVALHHQTTYFYDRLVNLSPQIVRLRPAPHCRTPILSYSLKVSPGEHFINLQQDPHGNFLARLVFPKPTHELSVEVDLVAEMNVINPFDFFIEASAEQFPFPYDAWLSKELKPFLEAETLGPKLGEWLASVDRTPRNTVDFLVELNQRLQKDITYLVRMEAGVQSCEETLSLRSGSCRDTAWLLVQILRHLGLAARFVSGYLIQLTADLKPLDGPAGPESDFTDLHAWTEVYLPGAGWVGLDPTSGLFAAEGHIPLASTPDPLSAAPVSGAVDPCEVTFGHAMSVARIHEDPRVTKPYTDEVWETISALGHEVDQRLRESGLKLTMGGEPTFISIDDMEGDEWNTDALGPAKRRLSVELLDRLKERFAPGGLLHYGQGKWYPGESLPRWALGCFWRADGEPIWEHDELFADERRDDGFGAAEAQHFVDALARRLGVDMGHSQPAYEDVWYYLWRERRLPANVDPLKSRLEEAEERERLARVFEQGLGSVVGYALPLRRTAGLDGPQWVSGPWFLRTEHMFLIPGDSPMGYRLPLDSLPWLAPEFRPQLFELDPMVERAPLPAYEEYARHRAGCAMAPQARSVITAQPRVYSGGGRADGHGPGDGAHDGEGGGNGHHAAVESLDSSTAPPPSDERIRTALCVQPRDGRLYIFLPPQETLEDFLDLISAIEQTARELSMPVILEGYPPPHDPRLRHVKVTPDPGVIEVNVPPAHDWEELVTWVTGLYDEARQTRLGTEKFMLDGRHTGTGGGNHVVLGGPTPAESPFLQRPDLLRSLIAFWHNHPSLSYLFSGLFVGPTSQAPRVDEGRADARYEMEIAFQQIPGQGSCPPWLVDRVFRHLLVDGTGNTHRAEFCIDKLFSPDSASGRLGLVEFRAFEMPPHARMSLTQQLLLRAIVARFAEQPYRARLVSWGTALHDRHLLPWFVQQDFADVLEELRLGGFDLQASWFAPHFEFRFPFIGQIAQRGLHVELRTAIEPWYVLGEEGGAGATVRYVDSSVERLQVKVAGMTDPRHIVTCNGRRVPLHPTGVPGEYVAGVRYRAWQPPNCLHPTIAVHTPLVFDIVDTWLWRSLGGCTYHVAHPGGRHYETFPVNAPEAEARRAARFYALGHTGGKWQEVATERNPAFPLTLDLRFFEGAQ